MSERDQLTCCFPLSVAIPANQTYEYGTAKKDWFSNMITFSGTNNCFFINLGWVCDIQDINGLL